jgi:hypothetical protein
MKMTPSANSGHPNSSTPDRLGLLIPRILQIRFLDPIDGAILTGQSGLIMAIK